MITQFNKKKLKEYLEPNKKVLIRFGHGLGDTIMFMPILYRLRELYPQTQIDLYVECGQEEIFASVPDKDAQGYDYVFSLDFPMSEGTSITKQEKCLLDEIGELGDISEFVSLPSKINPFVLVHFQGTALPGNVNCPELTAKQIWQEIIDAGFIPIECHFEHIFHNPANACFVNRNVRDIPADLHKLIGMVQHCFAFVGVASGPFIVALATIPDKTFFLEKDHKLETYTKRKIPKANVKNYQGEVKQWLEQLKSNKDLLNLPKGEKEP